jgi:predicted dehydrogenase
VSREVRIGLVGCGRAGVSLHLPALARVRGARVVALSDVDPARLAAAASACPGAMVHADYKAMLDDRIDLVAVVVPAMRHAEIAEAALHAGKHLFVEKPLALELDACDRLVALARRAESSGQRSAVGFNLRSHRLARQARDVVRSGELGEIELVRTLWTADWTGATRPDWHASRRQGEARCWRSAPIRRTRGAGCWRARSNRSARRPAQPNSTTSRRPCRPGWPTACWSQAR